MFGGSGVYAGQDLFALLADEKIYLKADETLKSTLVAEGGTAFSWTNPETEKTIIMSYISMPDDADEDPDAALAWGLQALEVAIEARLAKSKSPRSKPF